MPEYEEKKISVTPTQAEIDEYIKSIDWYLNKEVSKEMGYRMLRSAESESKPSSDSKLPPGSKGKRRLSKTRIL